MPGERVEEDVEQRVDAGRQRRHQQQHPLRCLWAGGGETQQGGEGEEGDGEVEEAVREEQPGDMSSQRHLLFSGGRSFVGATVEASVGDRHQEETQRVEEHEGDREGQRGGGGGGRQRQTEGGATVSGHQGGQRDGEAQQETQTDGEMDGQR